MGKIHLEISSSLNSCLGYLRAYSWYNQKTGERIIDKKDASSRVIESNTYGRSRASIQRDLNQLKEQGIVTEKNKQYIIKEPVGSYIELPEEFVKKMLRTFNADTINIYNWLYRRWKYCGINQKPCLFSYGDLAEQAMGKYNNDRNRKQAQENLSQLVLNGLIAYRIVRIGKTYLRMLEYIKTEFVVGEVFNLYEKEIMSNGKEYVDITNNIVEDVALEDIESVGMLGLPEDATSENLLPALFLEKQGIFEYKTIKELMPGIDDKEQLERELKWIGEQDSRNAAYVKFELENLSKEE